MDVHAHNFEHALKVIEVALQQAAYVAIDLELTGVSASGEPDSYSDYAEERLEKACRIAECHAPIQLGITICSTSQELSSYSVTVAPESTFLCGLSALRFVREHNVDLNVWVDEGVRHLTCEEAQYPGCVFHCRDDLLEPMQRMQTAAPGSSFLCRASRLRRERLRGLDLNAWVQYQSDTVNGDADMFGYPEANTSCMALADELEGRKVGLPRLWRAIKNTHKPVVVHGFLDVLFLLAWFEQRVLPRDPAKLAALVQRCFSRGVYDTAHLHESIPDLRLCPLGLQSFLQCVREHHLRRLGCEQFMLERFTAERYGDCLRNDGGELTHEAGFDSLQTALLFGCLQETYRSVVKHSTNRFYLHKSTDYMNLQSAAAGKHLATKIFDGAKPVVAELLDWDARENTAMRISEARRIDKEHSFFYRKMDEHLLLIPDCTEAQLVHLSPKLPGVRWVDFHTWQQEARSERQRPPDRGSRFSGHVKSFNSVKGYGFISSSDCQRIYGRDVYLHHVQASGFWEGQHVSFLVTCNDKGQPQAHELQDCWFTGFVRMIDVGTGCASISCPSTFRMYSNDVLLCKGQLDGCQVGEFVSFSLAVKRGRPVVRNVRWPSRAACMDPGPLSTWVSGHKDHLWNCGECGSAAGLDVMKGRNGLMYCKGCWLAFLLAKDHALPRSKFFGG